MSSVIDFYSVFVLTFWVNFACKVSECHEFEFLWPETSFIEYILNNKPDLRDLQIDSTLPNALMYDFGLFNQMVDDVSQAEAEICQT